jgi:hypothetical protein
MVNQKILTIVASTIACLLLVPDGVRSIEINLSGNGSGSQSVVVTDVSQQTNVTQSNQTSEATSVDIVADTGSNQISGSSGEATIITGDVSQETQVSTKVNSSEVSVGCCESNIGIIITGNGEDSHNQVDVSLSKQTGVTINQSSDSHIEVKKSSSSGGNSIKGSSGDALIITGSIESETDVKRVVNTASVETGCCDEVGLSAKIGANGSGTTNLIRYEDYVRRTIVINNIDLSQVNVIELATTGDNHLIDNLGDATIITGGILLKTYLSTDANNSKVALCTDCSDDTPEGPQDPEDPDDSENPDDTQYNPPAISGPTGGSSSGNSGSSISTNLGEVLGTVGDILPQTGSWTLLFFIANILTFLLGCYLRLHSGRSPAFAYAI